MKTKAESRRTVSADADFKLSSGLYQATGREIKPSVTVTSNGKILKQGVDYKLSYKNKTYYVQVRTYMLDNGVRYYSGYCTTKKITIKK